METLRGLPECEKQLSSLGAAWGQEAQSQGWGGSGGQRLLVGIARGAVHLDILKRVLWRATKRAAAGTGLLRKG